jgi:nucleotide-binding universal stress UspA family protein
MLAKAVQDASWASFVAKLAYKAEEAGRLLRVEVRRASSSGQDVGRFLLSQAAAFRADLLVMGAYGHSQVREWMFGSVTRTVLYEAVVPVLMSR